MKKFYTLLTLLFVAHASLAQFIKIDSQPLTTDGMDSQGASWVDFDNDGDDDLFVTTSSSPESITSKDLFYINNGDGTFTKFSAGALISDDGIGRNSTWGDFDNDGLIDVFVTNQLETFLYRNEGEGNFAKIEAPPTASVSFASDHQGAAWGDYNNDGLLDLFLASYQLSADSKNMLFTNNGNGTFTEAADTDVVTTKGYSQDPSWIDFDQNGTLDLFVPNYGSTPNFLYSNRGNSFEAITNEKINTVSYASLGASWADYDNDGDFDVLIPTNVNASNVFLENNGNGTFSHRQGLFGSTLSSSACWADFDNDGNIDVMLTGGANDKTYLFRNNGNKTFTDVSASQAISNANYSWAVAASDYDNDGFMDFFLANAHGNNHSADDILYRNTPNSNNWIHINLVGTITNRSAIGAVIRVNTGTKWQSRTIQSKTGANAQSSLRAHFGLGTSSLIDKIVVEWPGRGYQEIAGQAANEILVITEAPFPVGPVDAQAVKEEFGEIAITWTDNSLDETGFRIERSANGSAFVKVAEVPANTTSFKDTEITPGNTYTYKIASMTAGGYSTFSKTETIVITGVHDPEGETVSAYPNPVGDLLYFKAKSESDYRVRIINAAGMVVQTVSTRAGEPLSVGHLPPGFYILATPNSRVKVFKK